MSVTDQANEKNGAGVGLHWKNPIEHRWSDQAPKRVRKRYLLRGAPGGWECWRQYLGERDFPKTLDKLVGACSLLWAMPDSVAESSAADLCQRLSDLATAKLAKIKADFGVDASATNAIDAAPILPASESREFDDGFEEQPAGEPDSLTVAMVDWLDADSSDARPGGAVAYAFEAIAWSRALRPATQLISESLWWRLFERLVELAQDGSSPASDDPLLGQLLSAELAISLAYELPELAAAADLAARGRAAAERGLKEHSLGDGLPQARHLPTARALLACWTRIWTMLDKLAVPDDSADDVSQSTVEDDSKATPAKSRRKRLANRARPPHRFEEFLISTFRLSRTDGSQMLSADRAGAWNPALFAAAGRLVKRRAIVAAERLSRPRDRRSDKKLAAPKAIWPAASAEAAGVALLRTDWRRSAARLAVSCDANATLLELAVGKHTLLRGLWSLDVQLAGETAEFTSNWDQICWVSDSDVDYLELEAKLTGGMRVQRQLLLARDDRFLLLADGVLAPEDAGGPIDYRATLELADGVRFQPAAETCEGHLATTKPSTDEAIEPRALVLPLALPEWRSAARMGELSAGERMLELRQRARGRGLFAPLFFDLDRRRLKKPFTWRRLTVAESLAPVADDVAVGQRVEVGKLQWMFYRSLAARTPRTVLGQHLASEFLAGRFHRSGEVDRLLEVETE
jgi:hypothetical protein